jgi:2-polyprenyl-6-hydroxyphenyl methylase/3-demethylubiquinone-9 3-methyltransferase
MSGSSDAPPSTDRNRAAAAPGSVDDREVARFEALAAEWWDPGGRFRPLHRLNPERIRFIRDRLAARFGRDPEGGRPLDGLSLLDIGSGGGLVAEPMARLGAAVTGIDPSPRNVAVAEAHARDMGLAVTYRAATAEQLAEEGARFNVVLALEVVEHVADLGAFLDAATALVAPGGALIASTLNRTAKAFLLAIVGAEYVLGWLPRGTHDWHRFLTPAELSAALEARGLAVAEVAGLSYSPLARRWRLSGDTGVNYFVLAARDVGNEGR